MPEPVVSYRLVATLLAAELARTAGADRALCLLLSLGEIGPAPVRAEAGAAAALLWRETQHQPRVRDEPSAEELIRQDRIHGSERCRERS